MTWVRTDDCMPLHPKVLRLSDGAYRLWSNALHFANRATTNGVIARDILRTLDHRQAWSSRQIAAFVAEIVAEGLWAETSLGFEIHDYAHYQEEALKEVREDKRTQETLRKREYRARKKAEKLRELGLCPDGTPTGHVPGTSSGHDTGQDAGHVPGQPMGHAAGQVRDARGDARAALSQPPGPTRPDPARDVLRTQGARAGDPDGLRAKLRSGYRDGYEAKLGRAPAHKAMSHPEWDAICAEVVSRLPDTTPTEAAAVVLGAFFACSKAERLGFPVGQIGTGIDAYCAGKPAETVARKPTQAIDPSRRIGVLD